MKVFDPANSSTTQRPGAIGVGLALATLVATPTAGASPHQSTTNGATHNGAATVESGQLQGLRYHVVAPGETLKSVANRYGVSIEQIRRANGMTSSTLYAGYRLLLDDPNPKQPLPGAGSTPSTAAASPAAPAPADVVTIPYRVASGDTLDKIARRHAMSVAAIRWINAIENPNRITIGDNLVLVEGVTGGHGAAATPAAVAAPSMVCPVAGARYSYDWGNTRSDARFHQGLDLFAPAGTQIRAIASGTVQSGTSPTAGNWVSIRTSDGWQYYGAHLASVSASGRVTAGDVIGTVGTSGNAAGTTPHLHLEARPIDGRPTNPLPLISDLC